MQKCYKCKENNGVIKIRENISCQKCCWYVIEHLFKVNLSKSKSKHDKNLLVACSGGSSSMLLLFLLKQCIIGTGRSRIDLNIEVIHIITPETIKYIDKIKEICDNYGFKITFKEMEFSEIEYNNIKLNTKYFFK